MVGGKGPCIVGCGKCSRELADLLVAWRRVGGRHADNQSSKWRVASRSRADASDSCSSAAVHVRTA